MPVIEAEPASPLRRRIDDYLFEHPVNPKRILLAVAVLLIALAITALSWGPKDESPVASLPFVTVAPSTTTMPSLVVVHVAGAVISPGLYHLENTARIADALDAAGGPAPEALPNQLNLASRLTDGQRIWVPSQSEPSDPAENEAANNQPLNINQATATQLEQLTGIGPSLAASIVAHRETQGAFTSIDDLLNVTGIGPAKLAGFRLQISAP